MHIRQVSAFTCNENKHGSAGEPTDVLELVQVVWETAIHVGLVCKYSNIFLIY